MTNDILKILDQLLKEFAAGSISYQQLWDQINSLIKQSPSIKTGPHVVFKGRQLSDGCHT